MYVYFSFASTHSGENSRLRLFLLLKGYTAFPRRRFPVVHTQPFLWAGEGGGGGLKEKEIPSKSVETADGKLDGCTYQLPHSSSITVFLC